MGGTHLAVHLDLKINHTTINRRVPRQQRIGRGTEKAALFVVTFFLGNKWHWGGG